MIKLLAKTKYMCIFLTLLIIIFHSLKCYAVSTTFNWIENLEALRAQEPAVIDDCNGGARTETNQNHFPKTTYLSDAISRFNSSALLPNIDSVNSINYVCKVDDETSPDLWGQAWDSGEIYWLSDSRYANTSLISYRSYDSNSTLPSNEAFSWGIGLHEVSHLITLQYFTDAEAVAYSRWRGIPSSS